MKKPFVVEIDPLFFLTILIMYFSNFYLKYLVIFTSLAIHELAHVLTAVLQKGKFKTLRIFPVGLNAEIDTGETGLKAALFTDISGPLINILIFAAGFILDSYYLKLPDDIHFIIYVNISLGVFNMIPVIPLDGGRILQRLLESHIGFYRANKYTRRISAGILILLAVIGVFQFVGSMHNYSLVLLGGYMYYYLKHEGTEVSLMNIKNLVYKRSRFLKKGIYPGRELVVLKSIKLSEIIRNMDFDRFHLIYVLDEEMKFIKLFTEQDIIDSMVKHDSNITFDELINGLE